MQLPLPPGTPKDYIVLSSPETSFIIYAAGVLGHLRRFISAPSGAAYALFVAATLVTLLTPYPLVGMGALVILIQVTTSPEFLLRSRLGGFFFEDIHPEGSLFFGQRKP